MQTENENQVFQEEEKPRPNSPAHHRKVNQERF